jgi:hypothetical protein
VLAIIVVVMTKIRDHARSSQRLAGRALILGDAHHQARQPQAAALPGGGAAGADGEISGGNAVGQARAWRMQPGVAAGFLSAALAGGLGGSGIVRWPEPIGLLQFDQVR